MPALRVVRITCALCAAALLMTPGHGLAEPEAPRKRTTSIAILDLTPLGAPLELAQNLTGVVAAEVGRYDDVRPVTRREVSALLDLERQKQLMGCSDDSCLSQVVGALGVSKILSGQIGKVESSYVLTLHLIDTRSAKVEARVIRTVPVDSQQLVNAAKSAVTDLIGNQVSSRNLPPRLSVAPSLVAHETDRVVLDASRCYDPDGDPLRIRWRQIDGPPALLEHAEEARAGFEAAEIGRYTFAVEVADGRSPPQEEQTRVEVRRRKRFGVGAAFQTLLSFNRIAAPPAADPGIVYRNRSAMGAALFLDLRLSDRLSLLAEVGGNSMVVFPENVGSKQDNYLEVTTYHVLVGVRLAFPFEAFRLMLSAQAGTGRRYFTASFAPSPTVAPTEVKDVRSETLMGDLSMGVDIPAPTLFDVPFGEYVGVFAQGGFRVMWGTDSVTFPQPIAITVPQNGLQYGINATIGLYVRL